MWLDLILFRTRLSAYLGDGVGTHLSRRCDTDLRHSDLRRPEQPAERWPVQKRT